MKVALFLDVDRTLTREYIQHVYAKELGCEPAYETLERQFQGKALSSKDFGDAIIKVDKMTIKQLFHALSMQSWGILIAVISAAFALGTAVGAKIW